MDQTPPKETRAPINLRIKFRSESVEQFIERYAMDVSRGGIFIRTKEPLTVGTLLRLDFQFQNGTALMAGDGTVVWIREFDANRTNVPPGMGVRFDKLTPESQAVLEQLLNEKAKRERGGGAPSASTTAGGIAVRRPSSMFSALEAQVSVGDAPSDAKTGPTAIPPASLGQQDQSGHAGNRSLGTARKPFSAAALLTGSGHDPGTTGSSSPPKAAGIGGFRHLTPSDASAPFDDNNDEPTQIAGKLPSFLTTDEEATTVGGFPFAAESAAKLGEKSPLAARGAQTLSPLVGKLANLHPTAADSGRGRSSLDESPPSAGPRAHGAAHEPAKDTARDTARDIPPGALKELAELPVTTPAMAAISALRSSAVADATSAATDAASAVSAQNAASAPKHTTPDSTTAPAPANAAPDTAATATATRSAKRRSPAAAIGVGVIVLGAVAIFLARFFGSQATQSVPMADPSPGTVATAEPAVVAPPPNPSQGVAPAATIPPTPTPTSPTGANAAPAEQPATTPVPPPGPTEPEHAATQPAAAPKSGGSVVDVSAAGAAAAHKGGKHKATHAARDQGGDAPTSAIMPPEGVPPQPVAAPPVAPVAGAPGQATEAASPATDDGSAAAEAGHQIRVISKPAGADVALDGQTVGKTPYAGSVQDVSAPHFIAVRKDGFEPYEQMISASSAWSKTKGSKGKPGAQILKINAKLKQVGGAAEGKGAPEAPSAPSEAPAKTDVAKPDRPLPPSDETAPKAGQ